MHVLIFFKDSQAPIYVFPEFFPYIAPYSAPTFTNTSDFHTPCPRSGKVAKRNNPTSKDQWLRGHRRAERSYSIFKVRRGGREEIPFVQGKEQ